jgi:hypothetical protein
MGGVILDDRNGCCSWVSLNSRDTKVSHNPVFKELRDATCPTSRLLGQADKFQSATIRKSR